jgi:anti-sigma B factor antagonist
MEVRKSLTELHGRGTGLFPAWRISMNAESSSNAAVKPLVVPAIVGLPAELDITNAAQAEAELCAAFGPGVTVVIGDMSRSAYCDSSGIRCLVVAHDLATTRNAELRLAVTSEAVLRALKLTGIDRLLNLYPSLEAALGPATGRSPRPGNVPGPREQE